MPSWAAEEAASWPTASTEVASTVAFDNPYASAAARNGTDIDRYPDITATSEATARIPAWATSEMPMSPPGISAAACILSAASPMLIRCSTA